MPSDYNSKYLQKVNAKCPQIKGEVFSLSNVFRMPSNNNSVCIPHLISAPDQPGRKDRKEKLRAYCPNIYIVHPGLDFINWRPYAMTSFMPYINHQTQKYASLIPLME